MRLRTSLVLCGALALSACSTPNSPNDVTSVDAEAGTTLDASNDANTETTDVVDVPSTPCDGGLICSRPYQLTAPTGVAPTTPLPLVILLHGYGANAAAQDLLFGLGRRVQERQFLLALPNGTIDASGRRFWNATDACCNFANVAVDDVAYLRAVIDDASARYTVDPKRIYFIGHSNGGFMSNRLACELSDRIAGIVSLAGSNWLDMSRCMPTQKVNVLLVHGTLDETISYTGSSLMGLGYPGAEATANGWAQRNGCTTTRMSAGADLDLVPSLPGNETRREMYPNCAAGGAVELWPIMNGTHIPVVNTNWSASVLDWMFAHPKP